MRSLVRVCRHQSDQFDDRIHLFHRR
jgi:hypothetical protein